MSKLTLVKPDCNKPDCEFYGQPHPYCKAHSKRTGLPCGKIPMHGQFICSIHGGKGAGARQAGAVRQALTTAQRLVAFNPEDDESLEEGLLREVKQASQTAQAYAIAVAALQDGMVAPTDSTGTVRLHALITAWTNERKLHALLAKTALDAGIAQRQVDLAEKQASMLVSVLVAVLQNPTLGLSAEQVIEAKVIAAGEMRAISATNDLQPA